MKPKPIIVHTRKACPVFTPEQSNPQQPWITIEGIEANPLAHYDAILIQTTGSKDRRLAEGVKALVAFYSTPDEEELPEAQPEENDEPNNL